MKKITIKAEDAVGKVLAHDITKVVPGEFKGPAFRKGHTITPEDIPELLKIGREHMWVLDLEPGEIHEDEAGIRLGKAFAGENIRCSEPVESRVNLFSTVNGVLRIDIDLLNKVNSVEHVLLATKPSGTVVKEGDMVAGTKVVPIAVKEEILKRVEALCEASGKVVSVQGFRAMKVAAVITGSEVYKGRTKDAFRPMLEKKLVGFGSTLENVAFAPDEAETIAQRIREAVGSGAEVIIVTGGMSVDPDDSTPMGIKLAGAEVVKYGAPVLPGAMFLLAYLLAESRTVPVLGVPASAIYFERTVLDKVLPRVLAGEKLRGFDISQMAHGGLL